MKPFILLLGMSFILIGHACADEDASAAEAGTLKSIMQQLGEDYAALDRAILMQDFDGAGMAAHHIAYHEKPSMFQKMKVIAALGAEMPAFKQADGKVHSLAVEIEQAAKAKDLPLLIQGQSGLLSACMACHTAYRVRVQNMLQ